MDVFRFSGTVAFVGYAELNERQGSDSFVTAFTRV